ncbi:MAG: hypothetical protein M0C28_32730 [Candidatus Moduliflexus flocculans]|nr:hypothetical protein [Candidatus Moduliflexus flocculans]
MTRLRNAYPAALRTRFPCSFQVLSTQQLSERNVLRPTTLALFLYRVTVNEHLRARAAAPIRATRPSRWRWTCTGCCAWWRTARRRNIPSWPGR